MANQALAALESALRVRKLDRTLTTALAPLERMDPSALMPMDVAALDACLRGGLPRGQLSELAGPRSSGRMTLLIQMIAAATARGEIAAFVDTLDRLDVASAAAAGIDLARLLWIRGRDAGCGMRDPAIGIRDRWRFSDRESRIPDPESRIPDPGSRIPDPGSRIERALKALNLVLQAGGFGVVAIDLADVPPSALRQIPFTTWLRVQRAIEGSDTACVLLTSEPLARSAGGLTVSLTGRTTWAGTSDRSRRLAGMDVGARVVSPRKRIDGNVSLLASASGLERGL